jgi:hypothetical protein
MQNNQSARDHQAKVIKVRELNDAFRQSFIGGRVIITSGVSALPSRTRATLLNLVRTFSDFEFGGDPYGEHDFGSVQIETGQYFWKIDYYSSDLKAGSQEPSDPSQTTRVLTIMNAQEY